MSEIPAPPKKREGGRGWSTVDGVELPPQALNTNIELDVSDTARFLPPEPRQRILAMKALNIAFDLIHPELATDSEASKGFNQAVLIASKNNHSPQIEYFKQEYEIAHDKGLGNVPLIATLEQLKAAGVVDESAYWQAMAIVARLYFQEQQLKSGAA